jgi:hypothetical protein
MAKVDCLNILGLVSHLLCRVWMCVHVVCWSVCMCVSVSVCHKMGDQLGWPGCSAACLWGDSCKWLEWLYACYKNIRLLQLNNLPTLPFTNPATGRLLRFGKLFQMCQSVSPYEWLTLVTAPTSSSSGMTTVATFWSSWQPGL